MKDNNTKNRRLTFRNTEELSPARKRLLWLLTLSIPFLVIIALEISLRIFNYGPNTKLFISIPDENSKFYGINLNVGKRYFTKLSDVPTPRKDLFLKEKPKNGYRIFVLGGSSAAGFPYGNNITFTRILNRRLSDTFPDKHIEIVNTGMTAINTYTQLDFMDEILQYQPDAILIYSGHNEFFGALGVGSMESFGKQRWMVKATLVLQKFKTYILIRDLIDKIENLIGGTSEADKGGATATLMERIVGNKIIPLNSDDYELGKNQFKENISEIISKAKNAGVKVIVSELVSNIRDNEPFESVQNKDNPTAKEVFNSAVNYEKEGNYDEARKAYYKAKDLDALRFRAPEEFNQIIHEVAAENNVPVVPMKSYFESNSTNRLIGNNLMCEHLHPNIDGYFLMADAFYNTIKEENLISKEWSSKNIKSPSYYRFNWGYTSLDSIGASLAIKQLKGGWPFKKEHVPNTALLEFRPSTKVDSVALNIYSKGEMTLEQGHIELANYYESKGLLEQSFKEYKALIYTVPYLDLFYEPATKLLVETRHFDEALVLLQQLLKYQDSPFALQWIGQIYLIKNETTKGIEYLERASELEPQNYTLLYNLGRAYFKISFFTKGNEVLYRLKNSTVDPQLVTNLDSFGKASMDNYNIAAGYVKKAENLLVAKDFRQAYSYLQQSLKVQETSSAYELIGTLNLVNGNKSEALTYLEKANDMSDTKDPKLLYHLSGAYYVNSEFGKAKSTFEQLKKYYPDYPDPGNLESKLNQVNKSVIN